MNIRQVATGTLLAASLVLGGGSVAVADGARPAMDRGVFPCERLEHRIDGLQHALDALAAHQARLENRLAAAVADGDTRRVTRIETQLAKVARTQEHLTQVIDRLAAGYAEHCEPVTTQ